MILIYSKRVAAYQRSAPGRECTPGPASPGPGRDWIPGLNSMCPGAGRDPGTYFTSPGRDCRDLSFVGRELAGSRAGTVILPGTWKIPDIPPVQHIWIISAGICSIYQINSLKPYTCENEFKTGTCYKQNWPVFSTIIGFYRICLLHALFGLSYLVICWRVEGTIVYYQKI